jgi:hypothetical protein
MATRRIPPSRKGDSSIAGRIDAADGKGVRSSGLQGASSPDAASASRGLDLVFGDPDALEFVLDQMTSLYSWSIGPAASSG